MGDLSLESNSGILVGLVAMVSQQIKQHLRSGRIQCHEYLVGPETSKILYVGSMGTLGGFSSMYGLLGNSGDVNIDISKGPAAWVILVFLGLYMVSSFQYIDGLSECISNGGLGGTSSIGGLVGQSSTIV